MALVIDIVPPVCVNRLQSFPFMVLTVFIGKADMGKPLILLLQLTVYLDGKTV